MRLTIKDKEIRDNFNAEYAKLADLEDIEEELGIDILWAVNICKKANSQKKVFIKEKWGIDTIRFLDDLDVELFNHRLFSNTRGVCVDFDLTEYGKTWALTKGELSV